MSKFKYALINYIRNPLRNSIIIIIVSVILFGELVGACLYSVSVNATQDAFIYNGPAYYIETSLTEAELNKIKSIPHVTGVDSRIWRENSIPIGLTRVNTNTGYRVNQTAAQASKNTMTVMANIDVAQDSWFRWEPVVSLVSGEYPTKDNQGILIEQRFAEQNRLNIGDKISYDIDGVICDFRICGIFFVDTEYELLEGFDYSKEEDIYKFSPYNRVYTNYLYIAPLLKRDITDIHSWMIYVDSLENCDYVAQSLRSLLGESATIYDNVSNFLTTSATAVPNLKNISVMIIYYMTAFGAIILMLILSYFANQYQHDCGVMMALGYPKKHIAGYHILTSLLLIITAILLSIILYTTLGKLVISVAENIANVTPAGSSISFCKTEGLFDYFKVSANLSDILSLNNIIWFISMCVGSLLVLLILPITVTIQTKPTFLLSK